MVKKRKSFVFPREFAEVVAKLPKRQQLRMLWAIINYGLYRQEPELDGIYSGMFSIIRDYIDTDFFSTAYEQE
jgi:hypothetical protein